MFRKKISLDYLKDCFKTFGIKTARDKEKYMADLKFRGYSVPPINNIISKADRIDTAMVDRYLAAI